MSVFTTNYQHLIWDWNGTLLDDVGDCLAVLNDMLRERSLSPLTFQRYREIFNFPVLDFYRHIGFDFDAESFDQVARQYHAGYAQRLPACRLHPGAEQILSAAARAGFSQSLLSAYPQTALENALDYFRIRSRFVRIVGLNDYYAHSKLDNGIRFVGELDCPPRPDFTHR